MTEPTNHTLTVTDRDGKQVRGKVAPRGLPLQPQAERWRPQSATVHITCSEWLEPDNYAATYHTPKTAVKGRYVVLSYTQTADERWLFKGTFDADADI